MPLCKSVSCQEQQVDVAAAKANCHSCVTAQNEFILCRTLQVRTRCLLCDWHMMLLLQAGVPKRKRGMERTAKQSPKRVLSNSGHPIVAGS